MLGAIIGDQVGSRFEWHPIKTKDFQFFHEDCCWTDDTVLTIAVAEAIAANIDMVKTLRRYTLEHVTSYGLHYWDWANGRLGDGPYGSYGNGASMRVSGAAHFAHDIHECLAFAKASASVTHNHPEGIRGAQAVATAIYAALSGWKQPEIRALVQRISGYDFIPSVREFRQTAEFELKSWISVPRAIVCALEAENFEDAIRNAVSLGGDADTEAAIAGSIAEALFPIPEAMAVPALSKLPISLRSDYERLSTLSRAIERHPLSASQVDAIPVWDPSCLEKWVPPHAKPRPIIVYEPEPLPESYSLFAKPTLFQKARNLIDKAVSIWR